MHGVAHDIITPPILDSSATILFSASNLVLLSANVFLFMSAPRTAVYEQKLQESIKPFCDSKKHSPGMVLQLDCRFQDAYRKFANKNFNGQPSKGKWVTEGLCERGKCTMRINSQVSLLCNVPSSEHLALWASVGCYTRTRPRLRCMRLCDLCRSLLDSRRCNCAFVFLTRSYISLVTS